MPITRTFTVAELEEIGVPFETDVEGCAEELQVRQIDSRRWTALYELIFRHPEDGVAYSVRYQVGLTENQECDPFSSDPVTATLMEQREVTVTKWLPVEAGRAVGGGGPDA